MGSNILLVVEFFCNDHVKHRIEQGDITAGFELQHMGGMTLQCHPPRIHDD